MYKVLFEIQWVDEEGTEHSAPGNGIEMEDVEEAADDAYGVMCATVRAIKKAEVSREVLID